MNSIFTAKSRFDQQDGGFRFTFFCDLCGDGYTTGIIPAQSVAVARESAQSEARLHFNRCQNCHRWVCDEHYNENRLLCTACAPRVCGKCGHQLVKGNQFCTICGAQQYETTPKGGD